MRVRTRDLPVQADQETEPKAVGVPVTQRAVYTPQATGSGPGRDDASIWSNWRASTANLMLLTSAPKNSTGGRWPCLRPELIVNQRVLRLPNPGADVAV